MRQLVQPVRWVETVADGVGQRYHFVEARAGRMNKRIAPETAILSFSDGAAFDQALSVLK